MPNPNEPTCEACGESAPPGAVLCPACEDYHQSAHEPSIHDVPPADVRNL